MTPTEISKVIHSHRVDGEGKPLCWYSMDGEQCATCGKRISYDEKGSILLPQGCSNPDYTQPTAYLEAMGELMERGWWEGFVEFIWHDIVSGGGDLLKTLLTPSLGSKAVAEYLVNMKEAESD